MSARPCPRCQKMLPESIVAELGRGGTYCPFCAAPLRKKQASATAAGDDGYASFELRASPPATPAAAKPAAAARPSAVPARSPRATMVGIAVSPRDLPFDGTPAPIAFALSPPASAPAVRAPVPPVRAVASPVRAPTAVPATPRPFAPATPPRGLATVTALVADADDDSEPTNVVPPHTLEPAAVAPLLSFPDSEPIASVTLAPDDEPSVAPPVMLQPLAEPAWPLHKLAAVGGAVVLTVVAVVLGFKVLRGPKTTPPVAVAVPTAEAAKSAPEIEPPVPPVVAAPEPAPSPAPVAPPARSDARSAPRAGATRTVTTHRAKPVHRHAQRARKLAMAVPAAKRNAPSPPPEHGDPRALYERGNALLFAGDSKGAISAYREAIRAAPSDPSAFRGLGLAYEQQGEPAFAMRALRRYLKLAPNAPDRDIVSRRLERLASQGHH